jgi:hypothetical protein
MKRVSTRAVLISFGLLCEGLFFVFYLTSCSSNVDIAVDFSNYWLWEKKGAPEYKNSIPYEIVAIFEKHGFIWGGKWYHFDTMHFEYRPELLIRD